MKEPSPTCLCFYNTLHLNIDVGEYRMVTITKVEAKRRNISIDGKICRFHQIQPDQESVMNSCEKCFYVRDACGCDAWSICEKCHPEDFKD